MTQPLNSPEPSDAFGSSLKSDLSDENELYVIGIGASAGGLESLGAFFETISTKPPFAYVVIQHLSPDFESHMKQLLSRKTDLPVQQAEDGAEIKARNAYLIPPGKTLTVANGRFVLGERQKNTLSYPIDVFFNSLANEFGKNAAAVVLSGTGSDGSRGILKIREKGGLVLAQSLNEAEFGGMPESAQSSGQVDLTMMVRQMPEVLLEFFQMKVEREELVRRHELEQMAVAGIEGSPEARIFMALEKRFGIEFSHYKPKTITRRIDRRIGLGDCQNWKDYADFLEDEPSELENLYRDLLIGVTYFFRDPDAFETLRELVIDPLVASATEELRIWVAGCASGEEAYTLGILFLEAFERIEKPPFFKIFATDAHADSVRIASRGIYDEGTFKFVSPQRMEKFFQRESAKTYQVQRTLRHHIVFTQHNVMRTAPFTNLHLATCRNLLIYLKTYAQRRVFSYLHFGLRADGYLMLGPSESLGDLGEEFITLHTKWNIFRKRREVRLMKELTEKSALGPASMQPQPKLPETDGSGNTPPWTKKIEESEILRTYDDLLNRYLPPGVLLDENLRVKHVFEGAEEYLRIPVGRSAHTIFDLIHEDLQTAVNSALHRCVRENEPVRFNKVAFQRGTDEQRSVSVAIEPITDSRTSLTSYFLRFESRKAPEILLTPEQSEDPDLVQFTTSQVQDLEQELRYTRENLQATIEELETSNEELQAANEEMVAANEELQSSNEELHSINEELDTVNREFQLKIDELVELTDDTENMIASTQIGVVFLDTKLSVRKFSPVIREVINFTPEDIGRKITSFIHPLLYDELETDLISVLRDSQARERELELPNDRQFLLRISPYYSEKIDGGLVLSVVEVTSIMEAERRAHELSEIIKGSNDAIIGLSFSGAVTSWNQGAVDAYGYAEKEAIGKNIVNLVVPEEEAAAFITYLDEAARGIASPYLEMKRRTKSGEEVVVSFCLSTAAAAGSTRTQISSVERIVTKQVEARQALARLAAVIDETSDFVGISDANLNVTFVNRAGLSMVGRSEYTDVRKLTVDAFHPAAVMKQIADEWMPQMHTQGVVRAQSSLLHTDGHEIPVSHVLMCHRNLEGEITHYSAIMRDLSKEEKVRSQLERVGTTLSGVIDSFPEMVLVFDARGKIEFASAAARELVQDTLEKQEALPLGLTEIIEHTLNTGRSLLTDDFRGVAEIVEKDGSKKFFLRRAAALKSGSNEVTGVVVTLQDVTEFRLLDEVKSDLIGTVSHELKNPVAAIEMGLEMVLNEDLGTINDIQREVIATVAAEGDRIGRTISTLLDLNRFEDGGNQLIVRPEHLIELLEAALSHHQGQASQKAIHLLLEVDKDPGLVEVDASRLAVVFDNLISNAIKFSPRDSRVIVRLSESDDEALVEVLDQGPGIPEEFQNKVFTKFFRIPSQEHGNGLGLNIAHTYALAHGGKLEVAPSTSGTRMRLTLPKKGQHRKN